jgi:coenzyme F420 biosynthesis associated uncharacterized protein
VSSTGDSGSHVLVEWDLCERVALTLAGSPQGPSIDQADIDRTAAGTVDLVREYTRLDPVGKLPPPEAVDRPEWIRTNIGAIRDMSGELERRMAGSLPTAGPLAPLARSLVGIAAGVELGVALGYMGRKVLGQYEVALFGPARPPRLMFVAPNLAEAQRRLDADRDLLLHWIALHESTHVVQFAAVPWLREHIGGMVEELLDASSIRFGFDDLRAAIRRLLPPDPRRLAETFREGGLVSLLAGPEQARVIRRLQATMAVIEGYSEHVMDAVGENLDPRYARLRDLLEANRDRRGALDAVVGRLLGLDMKLRQYRLGKAFSDAVAERSGIEGLNRVWSSPDALPSIEELEDPDLWMERVGVNSVAAV